MGEYEVLYEVDEALSLANRSLELAGVNSRMKFLFANYDLMDYVKSLDIYEDLKEMCPENIIEVGVKKISEDLNISKINLNGKIYNSYNEFISDNSWKWEEVLIADYHNLFKLDGMFFNEIYKVLKDSDYDIQEVNDKLSVKAKIKSF